MRFARLPPVPTPRSTAATDATASHGDDDSRAASLVLDALTSILQHYAHFTLDTEVRSAAEGRELLGHWARHASLGLPAPGQLDAPRSTGILHRDWRGIVHVFGEQRRGEAQTVSSTVTGLRDSLWAFVGVLHNVVRNDDEADREASAQIERVKEAAATGSPDQLRREALATAKLIDDLSRRRRERQRELLASLAGRLERLDAELEVARHESATDPLTGLANRRAFDDVLHRIVAVQSLSRRPSCLLLVDIDHFKAVNNAMGHQAGDVRLQTIASVLTRVFMRRCDFVARYGGDEFAVVLHDTRLADARALADRLLSAVDALPFADEGPASGISIGIAELGPGDSPQNWLERADLALYSAKRDGRGRIGE